MTIIQAYRRVKPYTHKFPDMTLEFKPNQAGDIVCDVLIKSAVERLMLVPTGFRIYGEQGDEPPSEQPAQPLQGDRSKYVLQDGESRMDLNGLDDTQLREFCAANGIRVHHAAKGDTIRDRIVDGLKQQAAEEAKKPADAPAPTEPPADTEPAQEAGQ